jgi:iron complex transport system permease protein
MKQPKLTEAQREQLDRRIQFQPDQEPDLFAQTERRRVSFTKEGRRVVLCGVALAALYVLSVLLTVDLFNGNLSLAWLSKHVLRRAADVVDLLTGNHLQSGIHFWLCQFAAPVIAGMALAASGACFQALFHNAMASPTMLGVEAGGTLGATLYVVAFYTPVFSSLVTASYDGYAVEYHNMTVFQRYGQYFLVFAGCITVVLAVMVLVKVVGRGKISTVPLMIGGTLFTSSVSSILNVVLYYQSMSGGNAMVIAEIQSLQAGSFQSITSPLLLLCFAIPALLPLAILMPLAGRLNILAFGDEQAQLMGVSTGGERLVFILLSTVMTAAVVAFCGAISFVGLIVPHVARYLVGSDFRKLLPASAFCGGIFLLLAFDLSYLLSGFVDAGAIVNVGGGIVFMLYMTKKRRGGFGRA